MNGIVKMNGIVNLKGKSYKTVALRVSEFRVEFPRNRIDTVVIYHDAERVIVKAIVMDENAIPVATGHAEEWRHTSAVNKTNALENAETSAIGRALACLGLGGEEYASAEEIASAMAGQNGEAAAAMIARVEVAADGEALDALYRGNKDIWKNPAVLAAGRKRRAELAQ
jgi:hypothetical protein